MNRDIQAFNFEPEYAEDELRPQQNEEIENDVAAALALGQERLGNTNWCMCGSCTETQTIQEAYCCAENDRIRDKAGATQCISHTERFQALCLDEDVLRISLIQAHIILRKGQIPEPMPLLLTYAWRR